MKTYDLNTMHPLEAIEPDFDLDDFDAEIAELAALCAEEE